MSTQLDRLVALLKEFLGDSAGPIRPDTRFDELGLDSLASLRFARRAQDALGREIDLEWLFEHPTLEALARHLEAHPPAASESATDRVAN